MKLEELTVKELKELADERNLKYMKNARRKKMVELLLESDFVLEEEDIDKEVKIKAKNKIFKGLHPITKVKIFG